jgi:hypothetical protein
MGSIRAGAERSNSPVQTVEYDLSKAMIVTIWL